jgi:hypothetical protein
MSQFLIFLIGIFTTAYTKNNFYHVNYSQSFFDTGLIILNNTMRNATTNSTNIFDNQKSSNYISGTIIIIVFAVCGGVLVSCFCVNGKKKRNTHISNPLHIV